MSSLRGRFLGRHWWVILGVVVCLFGSVGAETHTYVFDPCQSTVLERNWSWGYTENWYTIEGEFQFTFDVNDPNPGSAWFDWVDANLSEEISYWDDGYQTTESLDILFHMTDLESTVGNPNAVDLVYEKNNPTFPQADVNVRVEFTSDSVHITGVFSDDAYDGDQYDLDAIGVLKKYGGGLGEANYPYLIYDANQMNAIGANPNDWEGHFKLMADIDLGGFTGASFNIIGNWDSPFSGVFDGDGHTISNFRYSTAGGEYIGVFGRVAGGITSNATIKDLGLINPNVDGGTGDRVGSLAGRKDKIVTIVNCYADGGSVSGDRDVGGLVGVSVEASLPVAGPIANCYANTDVSGNYSVGGLVGSNSRTISNCYARGDVSGGDEVGGLVGYNGSPEGEVSNCYSTGRVSGASQVGGLVGRNDSIYYRKCFWDSNVNPDVNGIGNATDPNVIGESTANMQTESTFTDAGWDFVGEVINGPNDIWDICEGTNYPKFVWQIPVGDFVCPDGVSLVDYSYIAGAWYSEDGDGNWDPNCDISEPNDSIIDQRDLRVFVDNYLAGI